MRDRLARWLTSLSAKYIALFVLLVAVPAIGISVYLLDSSYSDNKRALIRLQQEKAQTLAGGLSRILEGHAHLLGSVHATGMTPDGLRNDVLNPLRIDDPYIQEITYVDATGHDANDTSAHPPDLRQKRFFRVAKRDGVYFSPLDIGADLTTKAGGVFQECECSLDIAVAENGGNGVFLETYEAGNAFPEVIGTEVDDSGYAYAVTSDGKLISYPNRTILLRNQKPGHPVRTLPQVRGAIESDSGTGAATGENFNGDKVLSAWATVSPVGWKVFVEQPESAAFAPLRSKIWRTALIIAGFVAAALALSILLARRLVRPIRRMQVAAQAIGAGAYDERIELERRDELGALAGAFNQMAERVQELITGLERRVAERTRALEVASKHKSDFLANMSHELRTPLNAIIGFTQVLQQKLFGEVNEKQEEYLEDVHGSANHLLALINDVLDLSKVESGQVELELDLFSMRESLERGVVMVRERAVKNGVRLTLETDPAVDLVEADERRIRQVVFNLLSNAVKFTPAGGSVDVRSARLDGEVHVSVTDTGPGIALEDQERIFEEFQQTELGAEQREGTGLGLALSRKLVELHGGRIWVESGVGQGSTFTFTLPVGAKT